MNEELIQKFRDKSMIRRDTEWGENVQFFDYRIFADLIIKECIKIADDSQYSCRTFPVSTTIKQHFGVE